MLFIGLLTTTAIWADINLIADGSTVSTSTTWTNCTVNVTGSGMLTFTRRITISGNVTLNLGAGSTLVATKGIELSAGNTLTIDGSGSLTAQGEDGKSAIGSLHCGNLIVNDGNISATGGDGAAGIGGDQFTYEMGHVGTGKTYHGQNNGSVAVNEPSSAQEEKKSGYEPKRMNEEDKQESTATISWLSAKLQQLTDKLPKTYKDLLSDQQMKEYAISFMRTVKGWVTPFITTQIAPLFMDMLSFVVYFIIVPIFAFYMLKDKDKFLSLSKKYLCSHEEVTSFWAEMNILISKYLNGKCIHVIIIFLVNWIAFSILGLNYGLLLAIGVGLSVIIPYVGMIIITIPIVIIGLIQFGLSGDMVWLIAIYTIIQILDGYVLTPMLFSETLNLDPFSILVAIVVFGGLLGFWGVVLAIPLATFVKTIFTKWPVNRKYIESKKLEAKSIS